MKKVGLEDRCIECSFFLSTFFAAKENGQFYLNELSFLFLGTFSLGQQGKGTLNGSLRACLALLEKKSGRTAYKG